MCSPKEARVTRRACNIHDGDGSGCSGSGIYVRDLHSDGQAPKIIWEAGGDVGKDFGSDTDVVSVSTPTNDGTIAISLKAYSNRRMLFTDVVRLVNSDTAARTVDVGYIPYTFKIENTTGGDVTATYDDNVRRLVVWVLNTSTATGYIDPDVTAEQQAEENTYATGDDHEVWPTYDARIGFIPVVMNGIPATSEGWVTANIAAGGKIYIGTYARLWNIPEDYTLKWEIQARETAT